MKRLKFITFCLFFLFNINVSVAEITFTQEIAARPDHVEPSYVDLGGATSNKDSLEAPSGGTFNHDGTLFFSLNNNKDGSHDHVMVMRLGTPYDLRTASRVFEGGDPLIDIASQPNNNDSVQASNDILGVGDREAIALEFDELKKELLSIANIQDSGGSFIYAGYKSQTQPFEINSSGLIEYKGDRGILNLQLSESRLVESTIDGATVFQDIVTTTGVSTDLFAAIDNVSRSIRTATSGVEAAKSDTGMAKVTLTNEDPGTYKFSITSGAKSHDFSIDITGSDLSDVATAINAANLDITATLEDSNKTLKLVNTYAYDIELGKIEIPNIDKSQETPTSFFTMQPIDAASSAIGNAQTVYDFDQTIASRLDELVVIQNHLANQRAKVGARMNSVERQEDIMTERKVLVEKDVSDLADADLTALVTELQSMMTSQEASQKAFVRIAHLNLFDMLS